MVIKPYGFAIWEEMKALLDQMFKEKYFPELPAEGKDPEEFSVTHKQAEQENQSNQNTTSSKKVDVEEAVGTDLDTNGGNLGDSNDFWRSGNGSSFTENSKTINNFSAAGSIMTIDISL